MIMERWVHRMSPPAGFLGYPGTDESAAGAARFNRFAFQGAIVCWQPPLSVNEVRQHPFDHVLGQRVQIPLRGRQVRVRPSTRSMSQSEACGSRAIR